MRKHENTIYFRTKNNIAAKARMLAAMRGQSLGDMLADVLTPEFKRAGLDNLPLDKVGNETKE